MTDMWVRIASLPLAEDALLHVFGENAEQGPQERTPAALLNLLQPGQWPGPTDTPVTLALQTPVNFDVSRELPRGHVQQLVLTVNRMTVYCGKSLIGYALRTDELGLNALRTYWQTVEAHRRQLRQAH